MHTKKAIIDYNTKMFNLISIGIYNINSCPNKSFCKYFENDQISVTKSEIFRPI